MCAYDGLRRMDIRGTPSETPTVADLYIDRTPCSPSLPLAFDFDPAMTYKILVGGYTDSGLRVLTFDPSSDHKLRVAPHTITAGSNPSWIASHPLDTSLVFAANEVEDGRVILIKLSRVQTTGEVIGELVANVSSGGIHPAHLLVMKDSVIVANVCTQ
jgi:6-phosphogluconolactonase (cycloisomerase 2 family)